MSYAFPGEESRLPNPNGEGPWNHAEWPNWYQQMAPSPTVVLATTTFMSDPQLDSIKTIHDLDALLNIEAADEREAKAYQKARISE